MTTDELRAWMQALEERDVRIVALEKDLHALTLNVSELARQLGALKLQVARIPGQGRIGGGRLPADAHTQAASQIFGVPPEQVTPLQRANAKSLTFGERMLGGMKRTAEVRAAEAEADRLAGPELMSEYRAAAKQEPESFPHIACRLGKFPITGASLRDVEAAEVRLHDIAQLCITRHPEEDVSKHWYSDGKLGLLQDALRKGPQNSKWSRHALIWAMSGFGTFTSGELQALEGAGWGQWLR